jgi:hypothetical protein
VGREVLADVPASTLHEDAPCTTGPWRRPAIWTPAKPTTRPTAGAPDCAADLLALLEDPSWVYRQYDHQLFLNTVVAPGGDAALLRLAGPGGDSGPPGERRGLALSTDGNARWCSLDPRAGTALVVAESRSTWPASGPDPVALVNCLNFGNPEHPEVMWQLSEAIDGMAEACRALSVPVIGGNVSLYNESRGPRHRPHPGRRHARPGRSPRAAPARVSSLVEGSHSPCSAQSETSRPLPRSRAPGGRWSSMVIGAGGCPTWTWSAPRSAVSLVADLVDAPGRPRRRGPRRVGRRPRGRPGRDGCATAGVGFAVEGSRSRGPLRGGAVSGGSQRAVSLPRRSPAPDRAAGSGSPYWAAAAATAWSVEGLLDVSLTEAVALARSWLPDALGASSVAGSPT